MLSRRGIGLAGSSLYLITLDSLTARHNYSLVQDSMLAVRVMTLLALCGRYCSAQVGGCTPPAGSNLIGGNGKLSNNIPMSNRGGPGSESIN